MLISVRFVKLEVGGPFGPQREQGPPQLSQLSEVGGPFFKRHPSRATAWLVHLYTTEYSKISSQAMEWNDISHTIYSWSENNKAIALNGCDINHGDTSAIVNLACN